MQHPTNPKDSTPKRERKPYTPPRVSEEAEFEGTVLKCGRSDFTCAGNVSGAS